MEGRRWGTDIMVGGMQMSTAALLWSSLCSPPAPSAEWRWVTRTKQGWLTGRATPGPWIQRKSKSALGNLCLAWFLAPIIFPSVKAAGSGEFRRSISTAFSEWSYLMPHLCRRSEFPLASSGPTPAAPSTSRLWQHTWCDAQWAVTVWLGDTSRRNWKIRGHIQMFPSPHNSKCEDSRITPRRPGWMGRLSLVKASPGKCTDRWLNLLFCTSFVKTVNRAHNQERGDSDLQVAEWGRNTERWKKENNAFSASTICQAWTSLVVQWSWLPSNAGDMGSIPPPGRFRMPWGNQAHVPRLLSPCTPRPTLCNKRSHRSEKPAHHK